LVFHSFQNSIVCEISNKIYMSMTTLASTWTEISLLAGIPVLL
jgi:hypothetical protein